MSTTMYLRVGEQIIFLGFDKRGEPNYGKLIKDVREAIGLTREQLAEFYGKELKGEPMTAKAIEVMEEYNQVPVNKERRRVLARLLDIPPVMLGLRSLEDILGTPDIAPVLSILNERHVDILEYKGALQSYWTRSNERTAVDVLEEIIGRVNNLHQQIPYLSANGQRDYMQQLLCEYHMLVADITYDEHLNKQALRYLDKAIRMSEVSGYDELYSVALFRRGNVLFRLGGIEASQNNLSAAENYFKAAIRDYNNALSGLDYKDAARPRLPLHIQGDILLQLGNVQTRVAMYSIQESLKLIDQAGNIAHELKEQEEKYHLTFDSYNLKFNSERYHLDKASALLGSPNRALHQPNEAIEELRRAQSVANASLARRSVFSYILEARAHLDLKHYPIVVTTAQQALKRATGVHSKVNIARIEGIHQLLKGTSYGNSKDMAQLGVDIWKAKHLALV